MWQMQALLPSQGKDILLLPATGPDSWQLPAVSGQPSLGQACQILPALLLSFLFSVSIFQSMNICDVRPNDFLLWHIVSHPSHLNFSPPPSLSTTEYVILASIPFTCISCPLESLLWDSGFPFASMLKEVARGLLAHWSSLFSTRVTSLKSREPLHPRMIALLLVSK